MLVVESTPSSMVFEEFFDALPELSATDEDEVPRWNGRRKPVATTGDISHTPFLTTQQNEQPKWKGKGKAAAAAEEVVSTPVVTVTPAADCNVDWTKYEPPQGLKNIPDINSDIITRIIQESIENIKSRIAEEEEEKRNAAVEAEKLRRKMEANTEREKGKAPEGSEPESSANRGSSHQEHSPIAANPYTATFAGVRMTVGPHGLLRPAPPPKSKKRSLMGLLRRLNNTEKGESSAAGAARRAAKKPITMELTTRLAISNKSSPAASIHEATVECVSCLDDFDTKDVVKAPCHSYCHDCFNRLITAACEHEQQWPPKCCLNKIPERTILSNSDSALQQRYRDRAEEWGVAVSDRLYCSQPDCSLWVKPSQVNPAMRTARCTNGHQICTMCRGLQHGTDACPQDRDLRRTEELAEEEGWKRCYGCQAYVEHREACQHMTCRCGAQFCYVCGARWRTCACTMEQLAAIKTGVAARRQIREARQAEEEAEIAEALRQVEEFEREEALKTELLREEQERLAEERRQKILEERIRREETRRRAVEVKFEELRDTIRNLHELQRIFVICDQNKEESQVDAAIAQMSEKQKETTRAARKALESETKIKLQERERDLENELIARLQIERRTEEEYHEQLKLYWAGKKGGEGKSEAALLDLKRKMDHGFRSWRKWMQQELDTHHYLVQEEEVIGLELMEEAERRLAKDAAQQRLDFSNKKKAEHRWVDVVVEERNRMLNEMEVDEIENGEDIDAWFAEGGLDDIDADGASESSMM